MKQNGKPIRAGGVVTKLCALLIAVITLLPFAYVLSISLKTKNDLYVFPPELFTKNIQLQNFVDAWGLFDFLRAFLNSFAVAVPTTLLTVLFCSLAAYAFTRLRFRGKNLIFALYLSTMMIPIVVRLIPSYMLINKLKLLNTYVGQILPLTAWSIPFGTFLMRQFVASVPVQLDEAAKIDGAGFSRIFWQIVAPNARSGMVTLGIYVFISSWNNLLWTLLVVNKEKMWTTTLALASITGPSVEYVPPWNQTMAAMLIAIVPVLLLYIFFQKYFVQSVAMSGIK